MEVTLFELKTGDVSPLKQNKKPAYRQEIILIHKLLHNGITFDSEQKSVFCLLVQPHRSTSSQILLLPIRP